MKKFLSVSFSTIASLLLLFAIIFTSMELVINDQTFIENEFTKLEISKSMGIHNTDLVKSTMRLIDYMQGDAPDIDVDVTLNGETTPMFALEQEHTHMKDVQDIYLTVKQYRDYSVLAMLILFLLAAVVNFRKAQQTLAQGYLSGAFIVLLFIGFLGTWALSDFSSFWTFFHEALFWNDLWLFDATESRMINMLPEQLFADIVGRIFLYAGLAIAALIGACVMVLVFSSKAYKKKRAAIIKRQRARKAAVAAAAKARAEARAEAKAAREKAKSEREAAKRGDEKATQRGKARHKKGKGGAQPPNKQEALPAEDDAAETLDDMPVTYAEDEDGYPLDSVAVQEDAPVEEVASIDEILSARKKPWRESAVAAIAAPEPEAEVEADVHAPTYAVLTADGRIAPADDADEPIDDTPAPPARRETKRKEKKPLHTAKKATKRIGSLLSGKKPPEKKAENGAKKPKAKKKRENIVDDTGFFDE